ncbi:hypothetical protein UT5_11520 [Ferrigenium sp. UT5]
MLSADNVGKPEKQSMTSIIELDKLTVPLGGQQIELQQIDNAAGGMSLLRIRIREGKRFTIFDIDAQTAERLAASIQAWVAHQAEK